MRGLASKKVKFCHYVCIVVMDLNIQLMHSFEVNVRICQPNKSDVLRGEVYITFDG